MLIAPSDRRFQVNPATMQCPSRAAAGFRLSFSMATNLALQRDGETGPLLRVIAEKRLQVRVTNAFGGLLKTFLTILERFDQIV